MNYTAKNLNREQFMNFFRNDELLNQLSPDDRIEIFSQILLGSGDISKERLNSLLSDYSVDNLYVTEIKNGKE